MESSAPTRQKSCCCSCMSRRSWRRMGTWELYLLMRNTYLMLIGVLKPCPLSIHFIRFLSLTICHHLIIEVVEGLDILQLLKIFCSLMKKSQETQETETHQTNQHKIQLLSIHPLTKKNPKLLILENNSTSRPKMIRVFSIKLLKGNTNPANHKTDKAMN